jgi:hypothetical protein
MVWTAEIHQPAPISTASFILEALDPPYWSVIPDIGLGKHALLTASIKSLQPFEHLQTINIIANKKRNLILGIYRYNYSFIYF